MERLEARLALASQPILTSPATLEADEADQVNVSFEFTDTLATGSGQLPGLDADDFTSAGAFDSTDYLLITSIVVNTGLAIPEMVVTYGAGVFTDTFYGDVVSRPGVATTDVAPSPGASYVTSDVQIAVFAFDQFTLGAGHTITAAAGSSRPLALLSDGDLTVAGTINVSASAATAGPSGGSGRIDGTLIHGEAAAGAPVVRFDANDPTPTNDSGNPYGLGFAFEGGGGGGFGGRGGFGTDRNDSNGVVTTSPLGGASGGAGYGDLFQVIQGGSGGGGGRMQNLSGTQRSIGGGGGGGIELGADGTITISGSVLANGGNGQTRVFGPVHVSGGGGAGGGILVHASDVVIGASAQLSARGGNGGGSSTTSSGGGGGGGGHVAIAYTGAYTNSASPSAIDVSGGSTMAAAATAGQIGEIHTQQVAPSNVPEPYSYVINWGDGSPEATGSSNPMGGITLSAPVGGVVTGSFSSSHTYADDDADGMYTITVTVTDAQGAAFEEFDITVNNVAPTLVLSGASAVNEADVYTLNLSETDPGLDTISHWTINWGDSTEIVVGNPSSVTHTYADGGANYTISATATDEDGTHGTSSTVSVAVQNVAPTVAISGAADVNEGSLYTLNLSSSDPGADTISSWTINWGDSTEVVTGNPASVSHTYADGGASYAISASATDEDGTYAVPSTVSVAVLNVAPALVISGAPDVNEGSVYTLNLSSSDPGVDTIANWTIDWGDGSPVQTIAGNPSSATHVYADGTTTSNYTILATAADEDGTFAANSLAVVVLNVDPTADAGGPYVAFDDNETPITLTGSGADVAGALDPLSYAWDLDNDGAFDDGNTASVTFDPVALGIVGTQVRIVRLKVTDGDGGEAIDETTVQIIGEGTLLLDGVLYVVGSRTGNDIALITQCGSQIHVLATFNDNNPEIVAAAAVNNIQVRMRGGNDIVVTTSNVVETMTIDGGSGNDLLTGGGGENRIYGGAGHDSLYGGCGDDMLFGGDGDDDLFGASGNDVLIGGAGRDILDGGSDRDLLIGGLNEDRLHGGADDDILIGGYTAHDADLTMLDAIMADWGSANSFNTRVATLTSTGGLLEAGVTLFDDDAADHIIGAAGRDLAFADTSKNWDGVKDTISLSSSQDTLIALN